MGINIYSSPFLRNIWDFCLLIHCSRSRQTRSQVSTFDTMSYAAAPPYNGTLDHHSNISYYHDQSSNLENYIGPDSNGPQIDPTNAEMLAEAQQHAQHNSPNQESDYHEEAALDESLSWIANANRQQRTGVHAPLAVSRAHPFQLRSLTPRAAPSRDTTNSTRNAILFQPSLGSGISRT